MIYGHPSLSACFYGIQSELLSSAFVQLHAGPIDFEPDEIPCWA